MIYSMTGFGQAEGNIGDLKVSIQMRSLNSKILDLNLRVPNLFKELEGEIRKKVSDQLNRGKIEVSIHLQDESNSKAPSINQEVFRKYYEELKLLAEDLGISFLDPIASISKFPEVFSSEEKKLSEEDQKQFLLILEKCTENLNEFRRDEGTQLEKDLLQQIQNIKNQLQEALQYEEDRIENVRNRITQKLEEYTDSINIDKDRFEQELIYYLEKFDVSEEKVRLSTHCQYFEEIVQSEDQQGKKLNFIAQEIGREINTLGSKANHAEMQKQVVLMKESLEKIKEQVLNIL